MLWLQYFPSKGLPREFAGGQLNFENILWRNYLGVGSVSEVLPESVKCQPDKGAGTNKGILVRQA